MSFNKMRYELTYTQRDGRQGAMVIEAKSPEQALSVGNAVIERQQVDGYGDGAYNWMRYGIPGTLRVSKTLLPLS